MNQWLNKLERKYGRYAIPDLIRYFVGLYCIGAILGMATDIGLLKVDIYYTWLCLDMDAVFHGQIWRLFTFLIEPYGYSDGNNLGFLISVIFFVIKVSLFFLFGRSLEQAWGSFRFNMYMFGGYILNILAALFLYLCPLHASIYYSGFEYIYWAMFFAFAVIYPDMEFLIWFVIPLKVKWLAILDAVYLGYQVLKNVFYGIRFLCMPGGQQVGVMLISMAVAIVISLANFLIFFFSTRNYQRISPRNIHRETKNIRRKREFHQKTTATARNVRHQCAVCGRNSEDFPELEFRYCSKCEGNYEYCSDHLFTHQHVKKFM